MNLYFQHSRDLFYEFIDRNMFRRGIANGLVTWLPDLNTNLADIVFPSNLWYSGAGATSLDYMARGIK